MKRLFACLCILSFGCSPVWADSYPRNPDIDVRHYTFRLQLFDRSDEIEGEAEVTIQFPKAGVTRFALDLVGKGPEDSTGMSVTAVRWQEAKLPFQQQHARLQISLPTPSTAGESRVFTISYHGRPADGLIISRNKFGDRTFFGDNWPDRAHYWLPTVDHPSDKATCDFVVTAPAHYQTVANGRLVEERDLPGDRRETHWRESVPIPTKVMVIGVARFAVQYLDVHGKTPLQSWVYPQDREAGFADFAQAGAILDFYTRRIGPFPYEKLANVQSRTRYGGMENASAIFYAENAVRGDSSNRPLLAHEIAHQWFGDSITEADWHHIWLSEGFATYFAWIYTEMTSGPEQMRKQLKRARERIFSAAQQHPGSAVIDTTITDLNRLLNVNTYQKGAWVLHMLRKQVGEEHFWQGIRQFYDRYRDRNALTRDFQRVMEEVSKQRLDWFFRQWLYRPGYPVLKAEWTYRPKNRHVSLTIRQIQHGPAFQLALEVVVQGKDGARRKTVQMHERKAALEIAVEEPSAVVLDPETWLLMQASVTQR